MMRQDQFPLTQEDQQAAETVKRFQKHVLKRLPLTFRPFFNQQLRGWDTLFPYERRYQSGVFTYLEELNPEEWSQLFSKVRQIEAQMGVDRWDFSTRSQTMEDASLLARSPYFPEWRMEETRIFNQIDQHIGAKENKAGGDSLHRLILMIFPAYLPLDPATLWKGWPQTGRTIRLVTDSGHDERSFLAELFARGAATRESQSGGLVETFIRRSARSASEVWILDAGTSLSQVFLSSGPDIQNPPLGIVLSYERLKAFREGYLARVNEMSHTLSSADEIYAQLGKIDVGSLCPPEVNADPLIREFVRSLFLSGNGAPVFSNSFVQWAAAEAFRRARPSVLVACFGTRNRPKPFTSVAIFDNQDVVSPLPTIKDLPGSAQDAAILAYYVWLSALRYAEYQNALCVSLAQSLAMAYATGPVQSVFGTQTDSLTLERLSDLLRAWLT